MKKIFFFFHFAYFRAYENGKIGKCDRMVYTHTVYVLASEALRIILSFYLVEREMKLNILQHCFLFAQAIL